MGNFLVFAGTTEGRRMVELLSESGASVCASVATEYGKAYLPEDVQVFAQRLEAEEMATLMQSLQFDCVIDATHPYASEVTENIKVACAYADVRYLRLLRPSDGTEGCVYVESVQKAVEAISKITGKVLLTTGSKDLEAFTAVPDFEKRLYPRILPLYESFIQCLGCGYSVSNMISMQGPFTRELNCAMMRQVGASVLVTKESGDSGGFSEKLLAAQDVGATVVVIGRPKEENGFEFDEMLEVLNRDYQLEFSKPRQVAENYFPMFISLQNKKMIVVGGSASAARTAQMLLAFGTRVSVISAQFHPDFDALNVVRIERPYIQGDCAGSELVFAVSEKREINSAVLREAKNAGIAVFVEDSPEECDFLLPLITCDGGVVTGVLDMRGLRSSDSTQEGEACDLR